MHAIRAAHVWLGISGEEQPELAAYNYMRKPPRLERIWMTGLRVGRWCANLRLRHGSLKMSAELINGSISKWFCFPLVSRWRRRRQEGSPSVASGRCRFLKNPGTVPRVPSAEWGETLPRIRTARAEMHEKIRETRDRGEQPARRWLADMSSIPAGVILLTHEMLPTAMTVLRDERVAQETSAMILRAARFAY